MDSSVAVLREKNCNRPVPQYGISSNRSCRPISPPPQRNEIHSVEVFPHRRFNGLLALEIYIVESSVLLQLPS